MSCKTINSSQIPTYIVEHDRTGALCGSYALIFWSQKNLSSVD